MDEPPDEHDSQPHTRRVAVLVVHGVGDQVPYASSRHVAHLLQSDPQNYSTFREVNLHIPVQPVACHGAPSIPTTPRLRGPIYELFKARKQRAAKPHTSGAGETGLD